MGWRDKRSFREQEELAERIEAEQFAYIREWAGALLDQLRGDVIRGEATEAQFDQFMAPRWTEAPETVSDIADTFKRWRKFIEVGLGSRVRVTDAKGRLLHLKGATGTVMEINPKTWSGYGGFFTVAVDGHGRYDLYENEITKIEEEAHG